MFKKPFRCYLSAWSITHGKARKKNVKELFSVEVEKIGINPSISRWEKLSEGEQDSGTEHSLSIRWKMQNPLGLGFYTLETVMRHSDLFIAHISNIQVFVCISG